MFQSICKCTHPWRVNRAHKAEATESNIYFTKTEDQVFQHLYAYFSFHRFLSNKKDNPRLEKGVPSLELTSVSHYTTRTFFCAEKNLSRSITDVFVKSKGRAEKREEERETFMIALVYTEW